MVTKKSQENKSLNAELPQGDSADVVSVSEEEIQKAKDFLWERVKKKDKELIIGHANTTSLSDNKIDYNEVEIGYEMFRSE